MGAEITYALAVKPGDKHRRKECTAERHAYLNCRTSSDTGGRAGDISVAKSGPVDKVHVEQSECALFRVLLAIERVLPAEVMRSMICSRSGLSTFCSSRLHP